MDITYQIHLNSIAGHLLDVSLTVNNPDPKGQKLSLPAWIPGSYMIRDFAKNVISLKASDNQGQPLDVVKLDKQTWLVAANQGAITIDYQIYAFDLSVRSAYICDQFAFFNGTSVFLKVHGQEQQPCLVTFMQPTQPGTADWQLATTLPTPSAALHQFGDFRADDYKELIDHPVLMGVYDIVPFVAQGVEFELILCGGHQSDTARMATDLAKIAEYQIQLFDAAPMQRYLFLTMLTDQGFGGLEHRDSTALLFSRDDLPGLQHKDEMPDGYRTFLSLCCHELFHTWHVKRIHPKVMDGLSLSKEVYTEQLWIYEGFTSYFDDYLLHRSGVIDADSYLELAGQNLTRLLRNQGRFKQSVTESSFDAWTRFYQQDASAVNNIVSYYNKGAVIAMCLDLLLMDQTKGRYRLENLMRTLWQQYGSKDIGTEDKVIQLLLQQQGIDLNGFLESALYSTDELPVTQCLASVGVEQHYRAQANAKDIGGKAQDKTWRIAFGADYKQCDTGVSIIRVTEGTAAYEAGLQVGDQLIAIDGWQVSQARLQSTLDRLSNEQEQVPLVLLRAGRVLTLTMPVRKAPQNTVYLSIADQSKAQAWLNLVAAD